MFAHRIRSLLMLLGCAIVSTVALARDNHDQKEREIIKYAQSYPASKIEATLPNIPYGQWLQQVLGNGVRLEWEINDCGEGGDRPLDEPVPACVSAYTPQWHCPSVSVSLIVAGDYKDAVPSGQIDFWAGNGGVNDFNVSRSLSNLASLERILKEVAAAAHRPNELPAPSLRKMTKENIFAYVQALDVHRLDPSLPTERFDQWLTRTSQWGLQWWLGNIYNRCGPNQLSVRVTSAGVYDPEGRRPPVDVYVDIGSWEHGIEGEPKLGIHFGEGVPAPKVGSLSALEKKLKAWIAAHTPK